jgi:hypothetical protein
MNFFRSIVMVCAILAYSPIMMAAETDSATGTVVETMDSGGYVYMKLDDGKWIAANTFEVSKGDKIQYSGAMEMNDFHSKSLDKNFDSILFVSEASIAGDDGSAKKKVPLPGTSKIKKPVTIAAPKAGEIKPLPGGKTVAEIYAESDQLKNQVVSLNARVVKFNGGILGKNWITLKDGTGAEKESKIVATSQEILTPGDLVVVKGKVATDVDLGRGYFYKVMLEEATFSPGLE